MNKAGVVRPYALSQVSERRSQARRRRQAWCGEGGSGRHGRVSRGMGWQSGVRPSPARQARKVMDRPTRQGTVLLGGQAVLVAVRRSWQSVAATCTAGMERSVEARFGEARPGETFRGRRCWLRLVVARQSVATRCVALRRWDRQSPAGTASSGSCWEGVAASGRQGQSPAVTSVFQHRLAWRLQRTAGVARRSFGGNLSKRRWEEQARQGQAHHRSARSVAVRLGAERQGRRGVVRRSTAQPRSAQQARWRMAILFPSQRGSARLVDARQARRSTARQGAASMCRDQSWSGKAGSDRKGRVDQCSGWQGSAGVERPEVVWRD